jgi:hypothetical protein
VRLSSICPTPILVSPLFKKPNISDADKVPSPRS